jgi:hypothetical protein
MFGGGNMENSLVQIKSLIKKYQERAETLKRELIEVEQKLNSFKDTYDALQNENPIKTTIDAQPLSDQYSNMSKIEAVLHIMNSDIGRGWRPKDIVQRLLANGFQTKSKNFLRDIYSDLYKLSKDGKVIIMDTPDGKRYKTRKEKAPLFSEAS